MNLEEFVREKYDTGKSRNSNFEAKYQMVLKRIHAVFGCFEGYFSKSGTRNEIVCDHVAGGFNRFHDTASHGNYFYNQELGNRLTVIFMFIVMNYYAPNPKSQRQEYNIHLDKLFKEFIDGIYHGPKRWEDVRPEDLFETRVRLGEDFEDHLLMLSDQKNLMENSTTTLCSMMLECKKEAIELFQWLYETRFAEEETDDEITRVYFNIFNLCEKIRIDKNFNIDDGKLNLVARYSDFLPENPLSVIETLENRIDVNEVLFEEDAQAFYHQFCFFMECFQNLFAEPKTAIDEIDEKEKTMLNYLLDEFGKDPAVEPSSAQEKKVLERMKSDHWEEIPVVQREKLLSLINDLIEDDWEEEDDRYERLNKYIRAYSVDGVKYVLARIKFKMKFPEVYRVSCCLEKLQDLYGNIENAEVIMSFLGVENLTKIERKFKNIFNEQEELYRYCEDPEEIEKRLVKGEMNYSERFFDGKSFAQDTEKSAE